MKNIIKIAAILVAPMLLQGHAQFDPTLHPEVRRDSPGIKPANLSQDPCGTTDADKPTDNDADRLALVAGATYTFNFNETINHNAKYLIAFSVDDKDVFNEELMNLDEFFNDDLLPEDIAAQQDRVAVADNNSYTFDVTVPDITCERCAVQLIQKMYNSPNVSATKYVNCIDVKITGGKAFEAPPAPENVSASF